MRDVQRCILRLGFSLVFCVTFGVAGLAQSADSDSNSFIQKYRQTTSETQRLNLCIDAINRGLIYSGEPIAAIDKLFGTSYSADLPSRKERVQTVAIDFMPFIKSPRNDAQGEHVGWYLAVTYNFKGMIEDYYLTNLHK